MGDYFKKFVTLNNNKKVLQEEFTNTIVDYSIVNSKKLIISFAPANQVGKQYKPLDLGWGFSYFSKFNISIIALKPKKNDWYRGKDIVKFLSSEEFRIIVDSYENVFLIGASMGGFAALTFSGLFQNAIVIAYAPQTTLSLNLVPWETRFISEIPSKQYTSNKYESWECNFNDAVIGASKAKKIYVCYDPFCKLDKKHLLRFNESNLIKLKLPFVGHAVAESLMKMGLIKKIFNYIVINDENLSTDLFYSWAKKRRNIEWYYNILCKHIHSIERKISIYKIGSDINPNESIYNFKLSKYYEELNRVSEAIITIKNALVYEQDNPKYLMQYANLLFEIDWKKEALVMIKKVVILDSTNPHYKARLANILNAMGNKKEALKIINQVIIMEPKIERFYVIKENIILN